MRRTMEVVAGIAGYGNSIGIPTVGGEIGFDESYTGNPLVNVFCLGTSKATKSSRRSRQAPAIRVLRRRQDGRDGIHGATMASAEFDDKSAEKRPAAFTATHSWKSCSSRRVSRVMRTDALVGIQDMGAAGLTSSSCEMASRGGAGVEIDVSFVPQRVGHDALRNHALRVAGAHAAGGQAGP